MHRGAKAAGFLLAGSVIAFAIEAGAQVPPPEKESTRYSYDALGRLVATTTDADSSVNAGLATQICYDPAGNRSRYAVAGSAGPAPPPPACPVPPPPPPGNQPPTTVTDTATVPKCGSVTKNVVANDSDPEGNYPLTLVSVFYGGTRGTASLVSGTSVEFVSTGNPGTASVDYIVKDSLGAESPGLFTVTVTTVNTCP